MAGGQSDKVVDDFFNLDDTSDIKTGEVVYYQDENYQVKSKEPLSTPSGTISDKANHPISYASNGPSAATSRNFSSTFGTTTRVITQSPAIPISEDRYTQAQAVANSFTQTPPDANRSELAPATTTANSTPEADYYQENYKEKYEASKEERERYLTNPAHSGK